MLTLYPSIHIKHGAHKRTAKADKDVETMTRLAPAERAASFEAAGFKWLHVVDLDAAFTESPVNHPVIEKILRRAKIPVQITGGIHDMHAVEKWIDRGAKSVVLASAAMKDPALVREAAARFPGLIAVKIDSIGGYVANTGWTNATAMRALDLALRVEEAGVAKVIYADINLDGALGDVDLETTIDLAFALSIPVIASGGVHSIQELAKLKEHADSGIRGIILGRALYNGTLNPNEALALAAADNPDATPAR